MSRGTPLVRLGLATLAALQLLITGAAAWADARLDAGGPKGPVHLETRSTQACAPVHPADCILHRFLSTAGGIVSPVSTNLGLLARPVAVAAARGLGHAHHQQRQPEIRGPPLS